MKYSKYAQKNVNMNTAVAVTRVNASLSGSACSKQWLCCKQKQVTSERFGLTRIQALHPEGQPRLGDGNKLQGDVELAPPKVTQTSGSTQLCDLHPPPKTRLFIHLDRARSLSWSTPSENSTFQKQTEQWLKVCFQGRSLCSCSATTHQGSGHRGTSALKAAQLTDPEAPTERLAQADTRLCALQGLLGDSTAPRRSSLTLKGCWVTKS